MPRITLPNPSVAISACPHCNAQMKPEDIYYQKFTEWVKKLNEDTLSTEGRLTVTATSDTNLQFAYRGSDDVVRTANLTLT